MFDFECGGVSVEDICATAISVATSQLQVAADLLSLTPDAPAVQSSAAALVLAAERARSLLDAVQAQALVAVDDAVVTETTAGLSTSRWYASRTKIPVGLAAHRLGIARKLHTIPALADALRDGRISSEHARVLCRAINDRNHDAMLAALDALITAAQAMAFDPWRDHVDMLARLTDLDGPHDPGNDIPRNQLTLSPTSGLLLLRGELAGEAAIDVADTLDAIADELFHAYTRDHQHCAEIQVPTRAQLLAEALVELCRRATATPGDTTPPRRDATLTLHANTSAGADQTTATIWGIHHDLLGPLTTADIPTWFCDTDLTAALVDQLGIPLDIGRRSRQPTLAQRRALRLRDGCCTFPGCTARVTWLDAHHLQPWNNAGNTDLANLVLLCRRHHQLIHRNGWNLQLHDTGYTIWTTPTGTRDWGQRHQTQPAERPPP